MIVSLCLIFDEMVRHHCLSLVNLVIFTFSENPLRIFVFNMLLQNLQCFLFEEELSYPIFGKVLTYLDLCLGRHLNQNCRLQCVPSLASEYNYDQNSSIILFNSQFHLVSHTHSLYQSSHRMNCYFCCPLFFSKRLFKLYYIEN